MRFFKRVDKPNSKQKGCCACTGYALHEQHPLCMQREGDWEIFYRRLQIRLSPISKIMPWLFARLSISHF